MLVAPNAEGTAHAVSRNAPTAENPSGYHRLIVYTGRLDPEPAAVGATLTESDGSVVPVVWRPFEGDAEQLPLYHAGVLPLFDTQHGASGVTL